jgi:hypothetical protein
MDYLSLQIKAYLNILIDGKIKITRDPAIIEQFAANLEKPGFYISKNETEKRWDNLDIQQMTRYRSLTTILLEYHGGPDEGAVTVLPITIDFDFFAAVKIGISNLLGFTQEVAFKKLPFKLEF